ncbi:hypothetical protein C7441_110102 [Pseudaminobacter salicylatoxidans]|uniref:Secreted protein n=1 Tax=Pseudaminobacter salicylatoxidans TaxID=93369 RepID=A0A316C0N8_PSESE|nr:hypothetical protein [Pseudaminobacter salicylatoxidans]PWJ81570.1 hypothetical protein C7441_110102 [Pseudaminobacter salicylatoxidans]
MNILRRNLLLGASSVAAGALLPSLPLPIPAAAETPSLLAYVVGTPGEYDWQTFFARSAEEAFAEWVADQGYDEEYDPTFDPDFVTRVPIWDGRNPNSICPADWFEANLGHCCERCGCETHPDCGGQVVEGEVVCEECLTLADRVEINPNDVVEDLGNRIACDGADKVRVRLEHRKEWEDLPPELWDRAIAFAAEEII